MLLLFPIKSSPIFKQPALQILNLAFYNPFLFNQEGDTLFISHFKLMLSLALTTSSFLPRTFAMKTIILISDTVPPDINGVATTLKNYLKYLNQDHYCIKVISPNLYKTIPCPFSPDVKLAYGIRIDKSVFEGEFAVHLLTEGPLGIAYRNYCIRQKIKFTTSYLTMFPEYLREYLKVPLLLSRIYFRWFHKRSAGVFCCTKELIAKNQWLNHKNLVICRKGVDTNVFTYKNKIDPTIPTLLYVGRVAKE